MARLISIERRWLPPGTKIIIHSKPSNQLTWDAHGLYCWCVSQFPKHYWCCKVHITNTLRYRISNTVEFFPTQVTMPKTSSSDRSTYAALELVNAMCNPEPEAPVAKKFRRPSIWLTSDCRTFPNSISSASHAYITNATSDYPASKGTNNVTPTKSAQIHPRVLVTPVFLTIPPEPVTPLRVERGPPPQLLSPL